MRAEGIPEGTVALWDTQRNVPVIRPSGEPDENQEKWVVKDGRWQPLRDITEREERDIQIHLHLMAIMDLLGFDDD